MAHYRDSDGNYLGQFSDGARPPNGAIESPAPPNAQANWVGGEWVVPVPSQAELDALADQVAEQELENNLRMKALGLVMADLIEQTFNVSQAVARQQVKNRFRDYYRSLL